MEKRNRNGEGGKVSFLPWTSHKRDFLIIYSKTPAYFLFRFEQIYVRLLDEPRRRFAASTPGIVRYFFLKGSPSSVMQNNGHKICWIVVVLPKRAGQRKSWKSNERESCSFHNRLLQARSPASYEWIKICERKYSNWENYLFMVWYMLQWWRTLLLAWNGLESMFAPHYWRKLSQVCLMSQK